MKVLLLSNNSFGLYRFRKELLQELNRQGHEVFISAPDNEYVQPLVNMGCRFIKTKMDARRIDLIADLLLLSSYFKMMRKLSPDVVMTYTIKPNVYGGLVCRIMKIPYLTTITGLGVALQNKGWLRWVCVALYRLGLKDAQCVFFQNEINRQFFIQRGISQSRPRLVPGSGVNLEQHRLEEYPDAKGAIKLLFLGRIMKAKGMDELIAAARQLKKSYANVEFHVIGFCEDDYRDQLEELSDSGVVLYHGEQVDVREFIKNAHAVLLPSYHEGMSNALLEAASTGRPALASDVPGCRETFEEGISGFGFKVKDVESLVSAIKKFYELPHDKKKQMGLEGRKKMEREYDRQMVIKAYLEQLAKVKRRG